MLSLSFLSYGFTKQLGQDTSAGQSASSSFIDMEDTEIELHPKKREAPQPLLSFTKRENVRRRTIKLPLHQK